VRSPFDCKGCAERREAIKRATQRMADWFKPGGAPPMAVLSPRHVQIPDHVLEVRALARFLHERPDATEADWHNATPELRADYREIVKSDS
jgi:hypothetical protein